MIIHSFLYMLSFENFYFILINLLGEEIEFIMVMRLAFILIFTTMYSIIRYCVFDTIPYSQIPVFILNKSISWTSVICLLLSAYYMSKNNQIYSRFWGIATLHTAFLHIIMSLAILNPEYYPKFFTDNQLNITGNLVILSGSIAAYCYWVIGRNKMDCSGIKSAMLFSCLWIAIHLASMGWMGWLTIHKWYGYMPPISLLSFLIVLIAGIYYTGHICLSRKIR